MAGKENWVTVKLETGLGEERVFFCGVMTSMELEKENQLYVLCLTVRTGSFLLDIIPHTRTYQKESYTYREVIEDCLEPDGGKFIMRDKQNGEVGRFLVQYGEPNWQFIKRLAGYAGTVVTPEYIVPGRKMYFGYRSVSANEEIATDSYRMIQKIMEISTGNSIFQNMDIKGEVQLINVNR